LMLGAVAVGIVVALFSTYTDRGTPQNLVIANSVAIALVIAMLRRRPVGAFWLAAGFGLLLLVSVFAANLLVTVVSQIDMSGELPLSAFGVYLASIYAAVSSASVIAVTLPFVLFMFASPFYRQRIRGKRIA
jgi:hypothetical protein